jgi:hypothetical protein
MLPCSEPQTLDVFQKNNCPPLRSRSSAQAAKLVKGLLELDQAHVFRSWPPPGEPCVVMPTLVLSKGMQSNLSCK